MEAEHAGNLIILHGWSDSGASWRGAAQSLSGWNAIPIDLPGFGGEPLVSDAWGVPQYAQWAKRRIEKQGLKDVVLLGHSFGGRVASHIASERPAWLAGLVLYGAPCIYRPSRWTRARIACAKLAKKIGLKRARNENTELGDADARGLGKIFRAVVGFDQTATLPQIQVPTLLIWGANDRVVPISLAREIHGLIPHSTLTILDDAGHHAHVENPNLFYGTVKRFLENL